MLVLYRSLDRSEKFILVVLTLVIFVVSTALVRFDLLVAFIFSSQTQGIPIGHVLNAKNDVRLKFSQSLVWLPMHSNKKIYSKNSIYTGPNSELTLWINESEVHLSPNSMIQVAQKGDELVLNLQTGTLVTKLNTDKSLTIKKGAMRFKIKAETENTTVSVQEDKTGRLWLQPRTGRSKVNVNKKTEILTQNDALSLEVDKNLTKLSKNQITQKFEKKNILTSVSSRMLKSVDQPKPIYTYVSKDILGPPIPHAKAFQLRAKSEVNLKFDQRSLASGQAELQNPPRFRWKKTPGSKAASLQIATDKKFSEILLDSPTSKDSYVWQQGKAGNFWWRVQVQDLLGLNHSSKPKRIKLTLPPPVLDEIEDLKYTAKSPEKLHTKQKAPTITWPKNSLALGYEIQIRNDEGITIASKKTKSTEYQSPPLAPGTYTTSIRYFGFDRRPASKFSQPKTFQISTLLTLDTPEIVSPPDTSEIIRITGDQQKVILQWTQVKHAKRYKVQTSKTKDFDSLEKDAEVESNTFEFQPSRNGKHFWRVKALYDRFDSNWKPSFFVVN